MKLLKSSESKFRKTDTMDLWQPATPARSGVTSPVVLCKSLNNPLRANSAAKQTSILTEAAVISSQPLSPLILSSSDVSAASFLFGETYDLLHDRQRNIELLMHVP